MLFAGRGKSRELIETTPDDVPLSVQIFSGRTEELVAAARWLEDHGYQGVDLNMGCPMAKVNGQGGGARLMCDTDGACRAVAAVVDAVSIPVTVKMRLGWDRTAITAPALAREFEQLGVAGITIHGRTRQQGFHGSVDLDGIAQVVAAVQSVPIVGNGDVRTPEDAIRMRAVTGCAAVAIGRGAMLDPWIFRKLSRLSLRESSVGKREEMHSPPDSEPQTNVTAFALSRSERLLTEPTADEQVDFLIRHFTLMTEQHGEYSCTLFRKFAGWYGAKLGIPEDLEDRLRVFTSVAEFHEVAAEIRERHGERESHVATALIKVPNGPVERW
jgi:tRNA-dihydrouridine synthase